MDKDILPELLEEIKAEFSKKLNSSEKARLSKELLELNKATFNNANDYAIELGEILARVFNEKITAEILPDGRMYYNIAERLMNNTLKENHDLISQYSIEVQGSLNAQAGLKLKGLSPELNQSRIDGIVERLSTETDFEEIRWILNEPVINFSQSIVDDTVEANVNFHYRIGLNPKINRKVVGGCCDWCREVAGEHTYPDIPDNIYKRHRFCRCEVIYEPTKGKKENVHTKRESGSKEDMKERLKKMQKERNELEKERERKKAERIALAKTMKKKVGR